MRLGIAVLALVVTAWSVMDVEARAAPTSAAPAQTAAAHVADGRAPLARIMQRFHELDAKHGWNVETLYAYPDAPETQIKAWHTVTPGPALWVLSGIHGEEPAGPNAVARELDSLVEFARSGVPVVVIPLCNPKAYRHNWRYPNTAERDWRKGGYSVGDAEYLLPDLESGSKPRATQASGPETLALTQYVLSLAKRYPPTLVLDLHEDELSTEGGYIYSQGRHADANPAGAEIVRLLQGSGIPLRRSGQTRFGETIVDGVISRGDKGGPIRDGSIDELLAATEVFVDGRKQRGPAAQTVIVVETPAFAGARLDQRVDAQAAVVRSVATLWRLNAALP
ncbi:MAG TPA: hypothetical protein VF055_11805 [Steroidobacteraceae bacterium]